MNISINVPPRLLIRLLKTLEGLRADYRRVHELDTPVPPDNPNEGKFFYQSDMALYEAELREKVEAAAREL